MSISTHRNAKPPQRLRLIRRHHMSDPMSPDSLQPLSIRVSRQLVSGIVVLCLRRRSRIPKHAAPFLDAFIETGNIQRRVDISVVYLHSWVLA